MSGSPSTTKHDRRLWLGAAGLSLFGAGLIAWWHWHSGDPRFVGKWSMAWDGKPSRHVIVMKSNGEGEELLENQEPDPFFWIVRDGHFLMSGDINPGACEKVSEVVHWITGRYVSFKGGRYKVGDVTPTRIRLKATGFTFRHELVLTRLPD